MKTHVWIAPKPWGLTPWQSAVLPMQVGGGMAEAAGVWSHRDSVVGTHYHHRAITSLSKPQMLPSLYAKNTGENWKCLTWGLVQEARIFLGTEQTGVLNVLPMSLSGKVVKTTEPPFLKGPMSQS